MNRNSILLSALIQASQLGAGNNDIGDDPEAAPAPVLTDDGTAVIPEQLDNIPPVTVDTCALQEEVALVTAATEAINAECTLDSASAQLDAAEDIASAAQTVVVETSELRASMESFKGSPMTKQDAFMLQQRVTDATRGKFEATKLTGSLEDFGSKISTDAALDAGLEGLGTFLTTAKDKLVGARQLVTAKLSNFLKELKVTNSKVLGRAEALKRIATRTTGDSNSSAVQLSMDSGWWLTQEGGIPKNLSKAVADFGILAKAVLKDAPEQLSEDRKKFVASLGDLANADLKEGLKAAEKIVTWQPAFPAYAKTTVPGSRTSDIKRSPEMFGGVALYIGMPPEDDAKRYNLVNRLDRLYSRFNNTFVEMNEVAKRPGKLDLSIDTLKPAEIVKLADDVIALLCDIEAYRITWDSWADKHDDLDRVIKILYSLGWDGADTTSVEDWGDELTVRVTNLGQTMAYALDAINETYAYLAVTPIRLISNQLVSVLNRVLEVGELSLATYSDNSLK